MLPKLQTRPSLYGMLFNFGAIALFGMIPDELALIAIVVVVTK